MASTTVVNKTFPHWYVSIACGSNHSIALSDMGEIAAWGDNRQHQCTVPIVGLPALMIGSGNNHSIALLEDKSVIAWGANEHSQCDVPGDLGDVHQVFAGANWSLAVCSNGEIRLWGDIGTKAKSKTFTIDTHRSPGFRSESR